jgi:hypothetical protein
MRKGRKKINTATRIKIACISKDSKYRVTNVYLIKKIFQRRSKLRRAVGKHFSGNPRVSTTQDFVVRVKADGNSFQYSKATDIIFCLGFYKTH